MPLLYLIIFLEGYVVLSLELLAIRLTIPFVGSGADTISIIIAGVLLPLAAGYYRGGLFPMKSQEQINQKLQKNFLISLIFLSFGLGYGLLMPGFEHIILELGFKNRLLLATLYTVIFVVVPVYLLGQTLPLISHHFKSAHLPETAGKILFYSTLGSFFGAVATTILFMNWIGVPYTACLTLLSLFALIILVNKKGAGLKLAAGIFCLFGLGLNSPPVLDRLGVVSSNAYNMVQIKEHEAKHSLRFLKLNGEFSSSIFIDEEQEALPARYAEYIDKNFVRSMQRYTPENEILIIGAGGFTIGRKNRKNPITYIDIDPMLQNVAEEKFLKKPLSQNKTFIAQPARNFLIETDKKYDLIVLDIGKGPTGSPDHLVTQEFFSQVKSHLKDDAILVAHYYGSPLMDDKFSRNLDTTLRSVFPYTTRTIIGGFIPWRKEPKARNSMIYIYKDREEEPGFIYTDTLNRAAWDKDKSFR